jgi:hypothetical protein
VTESRREAERGREKEGRVARAKMRVSHAP